tara:strand:+ start:114 stop:728 length:615 start_codon:yes stop_codon:yes gene_type:complete
MNDIVKVQATEQYFPVSWNIGIRCNYDCMYCPVEYHNNTDPSHSLEKLQKAWISLYEQSCSLGLKYKLSFTGGEPTINKNFIPFLQWLRDEYGDRMFQIIVTSNGSASYKYYCKLYEVADNVSFSTHSEHIIENKFFNTIVKLRKNLPKNKFVHVNIMDEYWNKENIKNWEKILQSNNVSYSVNAIHHEIGHRNEIIFKNKNEV